MVRHQHGISPVVGPVVLVKEALLDLSEGSVYRSFVPIFLHPIGSFPALGT